MRHCAGRYCPTIPECLWQAVSEFRVERHSDQAAVGCYDPAFKPFRVHDLRHRFAIRWLSNGGDIYHLSMHLGHLGFRHRRLSRPPYGKGAGGGAGAKCTQSLSEEVAVSMGAG